MLMVRNTRHSHKVKHPDKGLTALELMITLALATILMAAGFPSLREYTMTQQIRSSLALLHSDLKLARNEAISMNVWTIACPGNIANGCAARSQWAQGWLIFADLNGDRNWQVEEPLLRHANRLEYLSALSPESRQQIRFFPGGTAPGSNTSLVFCDQRGFQKGRKIVISNSGRIRQSELNSSDETRCPAS